MIIKRIEGEFEPWQQHTGIAQDHTHRVFQTGSHTHSRRSQLETLHTEIYNSDLIVAFRNGEAKIIRERHGTYYHDCTRPADEILLYELARQLFHNKLKIFQQGFMDECKEALDKIIEKHNLKGSRDDNI